MTEAELQAATAAYNEWQAYKNAYDELGTNRSAHNVSGKRVEIRLHWSAPGVNNDETTIQYIAPETLIDTWAAMEDLRSWLATQRDAKEAAFNATVGTPS